MAVANYSPHCNQFLDINFTQQIKELFMKRILLCLSLVLFILPSFAFADDLVTTGDIVTFEETELGKEKNMKTIEWSQMLRTHKKPYVQLTTLKEGKEPSFVMLFVQKPLIPFVKKQCQNGICKVKVTKKFQYGQNKEKTLRFLVYHDKNNKAYQHRFLSTSTLSTFSEGAQILTNNAKSLGVVVPGVGAAAMLSDQVIKGLKSVLGDPLRDF